MTANAVALTSGTLQLQRWGYTSFSAGAGETLHESIGVLPSGVARHYIKYDGVSALVEMSGGEKAAIDAEELAAIQADSIGAMDVIPIYANEAALPGTPDSADLLVCVTSGGSGVLSLALSTASTWRIFESIALA